MDRKHTQFTRLNEKTSRWVYMVQGAADKKASNIKARSHVARNIVKDDKSSSTQRKARMGRRETEARTMQEVSRGIYFIDPEDAEVRETMKKARTKAGSPNGNSYALHDQKWPVQGKLAVNLTLADQSMHASWRQTNLQEGVWKGLNLKIMMITLLERGTIF